MDPELSRDQQIEESFDRMLRVQQLRKNVSITQLCAERGIELKPNGTQEMIGHCPFHESEEPSFRVLLAKNLWECSVCDQGGSALGLLIRLDNIGVNEAIDKLFTSSGLVRRASASDLCATSRPSCSNSSSAGSGLGSVAPSPSVSSTPEERS